MRASSKKSMGWAVVLIVLGMGALYGGSKWLGLLIPAALFVWYTAKPTLKTGRN
jgi:4-hydroxybenzoate polyprenyltransferase